MPPRLKSWKIPIRKSRSGCRTPEVTQAESWRMTKCCFYKEKQERFEFRLKNDPIFFFVKPITISPKKRLYAQRFCFEIKKCTVWKFCVHFIPQHHSVEVLALFFYHSDFSWNQFWKRLEVTVWKIRVKCDHAEIFFVKSNCKNLWNWLLQIHYFLCLKVISIENESNESFRVGFTQTFVNNMIFIIF